MQHFSAPESWLALAFWVIPLVSASCAPRPIPIRIGNVTLSSGTAARGLDISVGSPQQPLAFLPQWPLNNSIIYGTNGFCGTGSSGTACTTFRGGQYSQIGSKTCGVANVKSYPTDSSPYPLCNYITDNVTLSSNVTIGDFPLGVLQSDWGQQGYYPQMALGLGSNSTILNALKTSGQIASRSWSMFWGRTGGAANTQLDGNFVFGGYDRAKVSGANYTQQLSYSKPACATAMLVSITDIILNFANGTDSSLFNGIQSTAITACIVPSYPVLMTMPYDPFFTSFQTATNGDLSHRSFGIYYYGMLYNTAKSTPFSGDITFQLDSGLSVRIPNDQLVVPNLSIDTQTGQLHANASAPELVINPIQQVNAGDLPQLGRQFLTSAYLMVNQDANEFTLWKANPTANENLVAIDSTNQVIEELCTTAASSTSTPTAAPAPSTAPVQSSTTISGGAIGGIVVGCIAVLGIVAVITIWLVKRRKTGRGTQEGAEPMMRDNKPGTTSSTTHISYELYSKPVLPGPQLQELYGQPVLPHHMQVQELPA